MRTFRGAIIVAGWMAIMPAFAEAQQRAQSIRVRIYAPTIQQQPLVGSLMIARADTFMLIRANGLETGRMPASAIEWIESSQGRDRRTWMRYGGFAGVLAVSALSQATGWGKDDLGLGIGGALLGLIGGAMLAPERWTRVDYRSLTR